MATNLNHSSGGGGAKKEHHGGTRTILRIKRRRTEEPLPYIRLEGLDGRRRSRRDDSDSTTPATIHETCSSVEGQVNDILDQSAAELEAQEQRQEENSSSVGATAATSSFGGPGGFCGKRRIKSSAVWKRLNLEQDKQQRSYRIVDAMLEGDGRITKRRKLTLLDTSQTTGDVTHATTTAGGGGGGSNNNSTNPNVMARRKTALRVLDPLSRMVDDSLQEVHAGTRAIQDHVRFITMDSRMVQDSKKWLAWCHSTGGNILHACALWNDVEVASEILQQQLSSMVSTLTEAVDGDGRTPYEVAQLSGHDSVCQVLEAFGGDTTNYVYDIFCLQDDDDDDNKNEASGGGIPKDKKFNSYDELYEGTEDDERMTVELRGGVGYWTPEGELVLEAPLKSSSASLNHLFDEDGDIDSNCEEYGANDYPDEDAVGWGEDEDGNNNNMIMMDENSSDGMDARLYHQAANNGHHLPHHHPGHYSSYNHHLAENPEDADYDAIIRGIHCSPIE